MNKTKIIHCGCENAYQDRQYGAGMRVTTPANLNRPRSALLSAARFADKRMILAR